MARVISGTEAQLEGDMLRAIATALTQLNKLREFSAEFGSDEAGDNRGVRIDFPAEFALKDTADNVVGLARRRTDGTWYLAAVIAG